jgi:hypothetical protein
MGEVFHEWRVLCPEEVEFGTSVGPATHAGLRVSKVILIMIASRQTLRIVS